MHAPSTLALVLAALIGAALASPAPACVTSESESNDTLAGADGPICSGVAVSGSLGRRDLDHYRLEAVAAGNLAVILDHDRRDDFDFAVLDASGATLGAGATSRIPETGEIHLDGPGTFYVLVEAYAGRGSYTLTVTFPEGGGGGGAACELGPRPRKPGGLRSWLTGNPDDRCVEPLTGPGLLAMGGNFDIDEAFVLRAAPIVAGGDVVVLRTSGTDGYNDYLSGLLGTDSVETLLVDSVDKADSDYVVWAIRTAEMVWIAGGDQSEYLNAWDGTRAEAAIREVWDRGGVVGGISAGEAVLGQFIYDPDGIYSVYSDEAVSDPCHPYINLSSDFVGMPLTASTIFDSHFAQRDRMGRLLTFMARLGDPSIPPGTAPVTGVGIDEDTSLFVGPDGEGVIDGDGAVYVLVEDAHTRREQVRCGDPVVYLDVLRYALRVGDRYHFGTGVATVSPTRIGIDGRNQVFYSPADPY